MELIQKMGVGIHLGFYIYIVDNYGADKPF